MKYQLIIIRENSLENYCFKFPHYPSEREIFRLLVQEQYLDWRVRPDNNLNRVEIKYFWE